MGKSNLIKIETTTDSEEKAKEIARVLVEKRLCACAKVTPGVMSFYHWKGKVEGANEFVISITTNPEKLSKIEQTVKELSSYELPEIVAYEVDFASDEYEKWAREELE